MRLGDLRRLIAEAGDPFAERVSAFHAADALEKLDNANVEQLPELFKKISSHTRSPKARQTMLRAQGVATHLVQDFKALQALVSVAVKDMR